MKTLYLDLSSGISGDMFLGAMLDLGVELGALEKALRQLPVDGWHLHISRQQKQGIAGIKFDVHLEDEHEHHHHPVPESAPEVDHEHHHHRHHGPETFDSRSVHSALGGHSHGAEPHAHEHEHEPHHTHEHAHAHGRSFREIRQLIEASPYSEWVKSRAIAVFARVARAEGKVHGKPPEEVHFHEVGAIDSIIDIVGACLALEMLGRPVVAASRVVEGTGWVHCAHGRFPVPTPATLEIFTERGVAISQCEEPHELVTPTGAALLAELVTSFGPLQDFVPSRIAYGLGTRDNATRPNVLRVLLGESSVQDKPHDWELDSVAILETNLDDISSEILGHFVSTALQAGALDVFHSPIQMKKNRPGVLLTVLCAPMEADRFAALMLRETTAFGVRRQILERRKLRREFRPVATPFGEVKVKVGILDGKPIQWAPEFESCREIAEKAGVPVREVFAAACQQSAEAP